MASFTEACTESPKEATIATSMPKKHHRGDTAQRHQHRRGCGQRYRLRHRRRCSKKVGPPVINPVTTNPRLATSAADHEEAITSSTGANSINPPQRAGVITSSELLSFNNGVPCFTGGEKAHGKEASFPSLVSYLGREHVEELSSDFLKAHQ